MKKEKTCSAISCRLLRKSNNSKNVQIRIAIEQMRDHQIYVKMIWDNQIHEKVTIRIKSEKWQTSQKCRHSIERSVRIGKILQDSNLVGLKQPQPRQRARLHITTLSAP